MRSKARGRRDVLFGEKFGEARDKYCYILARTMALPQRILIPSGYGSAVADCAEGHCHVHTIARA
jgi:hypothetical protein